MTGGIKSAIKKAKVAKTAPNKKAGGKKPKGLAPESEPQEPHEFIKHLVIGDNFCGIYYVSDVFEKAARNGNIYSDWKLRDKSGEAFVRHWGEANGAKRGNWVAVLGHVEEYNGSPQILADKIEVCDQPEPSEMSNYRPVSETKAEDFEKYEKYRDRVYELCDEIGDKTCALILEQVFDIDMLKRVKASPNSNKPYYGMDGGLLAHMAKITYSVGGLASLYGLSPLCTAVGVTAGLLYRVGAVDAFEMDTCSAEFSTNGKLIGVNNLSLSIIDKAVTKLKESNGNELVDETVKRVIHAVASSESGLIKPMTPEAAILSEAIDTDMKIVEILDFIDQDLNDEEFTSFDTESRRQYFKGK